MKISDAAAASGCHLETIRYYERVGLLPVPARTSNRYRQYGEAEVARLRFITRGRELGFGLDEIRSLLRLSQDPTMSCGEVDQIARQHLNDIRSRIEDLQCMANELERTVNACSGGQRGACTILDTLRQPLAPQTR
ncbi:MAG: helix-turn-helix domain-containing protein [Dokdonella sp.]